MRFYLGTHMPSWLAAAEFPLFISHRRLVARKSLPRARVEWALDSGGFSELSLYGQWRTTPQGYATAVRRYAQEIGNLAWAAPQDWMCEPSMLAKTGLTVEGHQRRTVDNYLRLRDMDAALPFVPVLQGWRIDDYRRSADLYDRAGVDLRRERTVGVGSVCRRQGTAEIGRIVEALADIGLRLHGFGVKTQGLAAYGQSLASADSMAWSYRGRRLPGCAASHKTEANCLAHAGRWRANVVGRVPGGRQLSLFGEPRCPARVDARAVADEIGGAR